MEHTKVVIFELQTLCAMTPSLSSSASLLISSRSFSLCFLLACAQLSYKNKKKVKINEWIQKYRKSNEHKYLFIHSFICLFIHNFMFINLLNDLTNAIEYMKEHPVPESMRKDDLTGQQRNPKQV
jgi:hypothetical protein